MCIYIYTHTYAYVSVCLNISEMYDNNDASNGKEKPEFFFSIIRYSHYPWRSAVLFKSWLACTRQQKRHWCIEQSYGLCGRGRGRGWGDLGEWHWNMYNIMYEMSRQSRFEAQYWMLGAGALGRPRGRVWGGRWEEGSGWGTQVYLWRIHLDIWQN